MYMLDTDIARHIIQGRSPAVEAQLPSIPPDRICISAVNRL
jgi:predicted nucleic acid-binding protein